jgi:hypothetical protein
MAASIISPIKFNYLNLNITHFDSSSSVSFRIYSDKISVSKNITAFIPYTKEYRVVFVQVLIVVRYA